MPRKPRYYLPHVPVHIVQRGRCREPVFFDDEDYQMYLGWLKDAAKKYGVLIHAYVLMTNHIHILATPSDSQGITRMMQYVGRFYVPYINKTYGMSGSIWEGRYKSSMINAEDYLLACMRYIELNPVRADMVRAPAHYRWSSYRCNGQGKVNELITPHAIYTSLDKTHTLRTAAYKAIFKAHVNEGVLDDIRESCQSGTPLGNDSFRVKIEKKLQCKVGYARRGRPKRAIIP